jgi:ATP-dependent Zn protease
MQKGENNLNKKALLISSVILSFSLPVWAACGQRVHFDPDKVSVIDTSFNYSQSENTPWITTIGTIKNASESQIEELVVEVKYFNTEKKLIDVVTQPLYGVVVPASQAVAFRVRDAADKPRISYVSSSVRVVSAEQRDIQQPQSKQSSFPWGDLLASWGPMLLLIGVWIFFMRKMNKKGSPQARTVELIEKQNAVLERLAAAAEKAASDKQS